MSNVIQEYLVRLGFESDEPSVRKFQTVLADTERTVAGHTTGMARYVIEAQGAIAGSFMAISAAIVGVADKAAMADQNYRLMGLRMMMTTEQARSLSMVTKALGVDLAQIYWDPELGARAQVLSMDIAEMSKDLGPGFEKNMLGIRNFRMEVSRLEIATQFLGMKFASNLFERMDPAMLEKLDRFVTNLENNIPLFANKLADYAVPALQKTWMILMSLVDVGKSAALMFTNVVGLLSGDSSIQGAAFSFEKWATAIGHVSDGMIAIFKIISDGEKMLAHFVSALALTLSGKFGEAAKEFKEGVGLLTIGSGVVAGALVGPPVGATVGGIGGGVAGFMSGAATGAEAGAAFGPIGSAVGGLVGGLGEAFVGGHLGAIAGGAAGGPAGIAVGGVVGWLHEMFGEKAEKVEPAGHDWIHGGIGNRWLDKMAPAPAPAEKSTSSWEPAHTPIADDPLEKFAHLIGQKEGFFSSKDTIAKRLHNPGDLRPYARDQKSESGYRSFQTDAEGWAELKRQIKLNASRNLSIEEFFAGKKGVYAGFAPSADKNDPRGYAQFVAKGFGVDVSTHVADLLARWQPTAAAAPSATASWFASAPADPGPVMTAPETAPMQTQRAVERFAAPTPTDRFFSAPASAPSPDDTSSSTPFWYNLAPRWLNESPTWYGLKPYWMNRAGDATKDVSPAMALHQRPILPTPNVSHSEQSTSVSIGGIYITQPGADAGQIQRAVANGIRDGLNSQTQLDMTQLSPAW